MRTDVVIIGAGPAGLMLSYLLKKEGIHSVLLEKRSKQEIEETVRAGVLEQGTVDLLVKHGLDNRLKEIGHEHKGIYLQFNQERHRIDFPALTGGKKVVVYPQHEVIKDLLNAHDTIGTTIYYEVDNVKPEGLKTKAPKVSFTHKDSNAKEEINCDFVAGCDGFHGPCRKEIMGCSEFENLYDYGWLGILAETKPASDELVYANHENGFALLSTRTPELQRYYLQVDRKDDIANWSDDRIWTELNTRVSMGKGQEVTPGVITQKNIVSMRSFVCETMQYGRLFLAGDAAHIVPPTGAKGMNLAISDVQILAKGLCAYYQDGTESMLNRYADIALRRIWKAQRFSAFMTNMLHTNPSSTPFERKLQLSELSYLVSSEAAKQSLAENYTGLPIEWDDKKEMAIV